MQYVIHKATLTLYLQSLFLCIYIYFCLFMWSTSCYFLQLMTFFYRKCKITLILTLNCVGALSSCCKLSSLFLSPSSDSLIVNPFLRITSCLTMTLSRRWLSPRCRRLCCSSVTRVVACVCCNFLISFCINYKGAREKGKISKR